MTFIRNYSYLSLLLPAFAGTALAVDNATPPPIAVEVVDHLQLPQSEVDGQKFSELSALDYDPDSGLLYAASDKALLFTIDFAQQDGQITRLEARQGWQLTDSKGDNLKPRDFNPEGIYLPDDGSGVVLVSENGPQAALFNTEGQLISPVPLPDALLDDSLQRGRGDGLESLTLHPVHGVISAPEEPYEADPRERHTIHATDGSRFIYETGDIGRTNIKSMMTDDQDRLLILERHRVEDSDKLQPYIRLLDPALCPAPADDVTCPTTLAPLNLPEFADADFEGMTRVAPDLYLIVSDDKIDGEQRSVFALLRITTE